MSTPMIGLKRKVRKKFEIINIDEYNTSKLNYVTETETENLKLLVKVPIILNNNKIFRDEVGTVITELKRKKIHSILTYKMSNGRSGCINRDINSVKNMRKIVNHWLNTGLRLENYKRKKKEEIPKGSQPLSLLKKRKTSNDCKSEKDLKSLSEKSKYTNSG